MTFSIELLPAPFGPMIARTSCSRTSNVMSVSAFTPPNASDMPSSDSTTSPMRRAAGALMRRYAAMGMDSGRTAASSMRKSAATMPDRPSSNFTSVSTCWTLRPE